MEKVRPWCGQPSDRGRLRNRTEYNRTQCRKSPQVTTDHRKTGRHWMTKTGGCPEDMVPCRYRLLYG